MSKISLALLVTHWLLLFGWGLALNNSMRGYLYCRIVMPPEMMGLGFTGLGMLLLMWLDRSVKTKDGTLALTRYTPTALFVATQIIACMICIAGTRY